MTEPAPTRRHFLTATALAAAGTTLGAAALTACAANDQGAKSNTTQTPAAAAPAGGGGPAVEPPVTTGEQALERLQEGNARFVSDQAGHDDEGTERRVAVSQAQHPFATVLGCVDSRVPIELVFDRGLGDLVVVRSAGEVLDHSVTGSLEFGVAELGTPLLLVLGHQRCGAVDATIKALDAEGDISYLVKALQPAVQQAAGRPGDRLTNAIHANVELVLAQLRKSAVIGPLEKSGKLKLAGAYYELDTGKVIIS
ncbi:carbonic anhydrase [Kribbella ginsengisoli]|uniref:Carbonic anhydrase n=1 Tax=Kribbella ginsengisoli TaxID=363865 RepID=A0ABP6VV28_9ACTN